MVKKDFFINGPLDIFQQVLFDEWKWDLLDDIDIYSFDLDKISQGDNTKSFTKKGWELLKIKYYMLQKYGVIETEEENGEIKIKNIHCPAFAKMLFQEYPFNFMTMRDTNEIYYYSGGMYHKYGDTVIKNLTIRWLDGFSNNHKKNEIVGYIQDSQYVDREEFNPDPRYVNLKNGIYDIKKKKLLEHTSNFYFLNQIPVEYNVDAKCPRFKEFLEHICMHKLEKRPRIEKTIQEYMGYSLYRAYPIKNYIILDGNGDNAKTTLLDIVLALIGRKNNSSVSLQDMNTRPFALSKLYGKLTNISDDLPNKAVKYSGVIKQITGNSPVWADVKNHRDGIEFTNYAKPWYACNQLPECKDITDAFFSRMKQITFLNKYVKPQDYDLIDNETVFKADLNLLEEILKELPGILNFALEGLHRLLKCKKFSYSRTTDEIREEYLKKTNPVHAYIEEECELTNKDWGITKKDFYNSVLNYCDRNGYDKPSSQHIVTKKINDEGGNIYLKQKIINGSLERCWIGIRCITDTSINEYFGKFEDGQRGLIF